MSERKIAWIAYGLVALIALVTVIALMTEPKQAERTPTTAPAEVTQPAVNRQDKLVAVCLPDQSEVWADTGAQIKAELEKTGYRVNLVSGDGTTQTQSDLLLFLVEQDVDCIITAPVDSAALAAAAEAAVQKDIPVISYGTLWMDTAAVRGYICYDYFAMGEAIAQQAVEKLDLANGTEKRTVELFMGAPEDSNAKMLYEGIVSRLQPFVEKGVLQYISGRSAFEDCCIADWSDITAEKQLAGRLKKYPEGTAPDLCICASDGIAAGVIRGLQGARVSPENWPLITGNGATAAGLQNIADGKQTLTISTDPALPAAKCGAMVDMAIYDFVPSFPLKSVNNNVTQVPTAVCAFDLVSEE